MGGGGQIDHHGFGAIGLVGHGAQDDVADVADVEIEQASFGTEDEDAGNELVVGMALAVGESTRAGDSAEEGDVGAGGAVEAALRAGTDTSAP